MGAVEIATLVFAGFGVGFAVGTETAFQIITRHQGTDATDATDTRKGRE